MSQFANDQFARDRAEGGAGGALARHFLAKTRRSKIVSRASAMSIERLLCATVPKIAFVIVLKAACLNHTEIGVSLFTVKVSY